MAWLSGGAIDILLVLLPGFVAAGVFHSLTSHPRPSDFGLVAQSLIFAAIVQTVTELVHFAMLGDGERPDTFIGSGNRPAGGCGIGSGSRPGNGVEP